MQTPLTIVFFEPPLVISTLSPLSGTRPLCDIQLGALTLRELVWMFCDELVPTRSITLELLAQNTPVLPTLPAAADQLENLKQWENARRSSANIAAANMPPNHAAATHRLYLNAALAPAPALLRSILKTALTTSSAPKHVIWRERDQELKLSVPNLQKSQSPSPTAASASDTALNTTIAMLSPTPYTSNAALHTAIVKAANKDTSILHDIAVPALCRQLHQLIAAHEKLLSKHIDLCVQHSNSETFREIQPHVHVHANTAAKLSALVTKGQLVFNANKDAPILIHDDVDIGAFSILTGPLYIARHARISAHSQLSHVSCGEATRIGGEVTVSSFHPFSNKSHFGFIGHSIIGSWVNLGAGTTTSNLRSDYRPAHTHSPTGTKTASGRTFLGAIIGDYTKTAILTAIYGGKTLDVAANATSPVTQSLRAFHFKNNEHWQLQELLDMQENMFKRRGKVPSSAERTLLQTLHTVSVAESTA